MRLQNHPHDAEAAMAFCRCHRWPIYFADPADDTLHCAKCGRDKQTFSPARWRKILAIAGLLLDPEREAV